MGGAGAALGAGFAAMVGGYGGGGSRFGGRGRGGGGGGARGFIPDAFDNASYEQLQAFEAQQGEVLDRVRRLCRSCCCSSYTTCYVPVVSARVAAILAADTPLLTVSQWIARSWRSCQKGRTTTAAAARARAAPTSAPSASARSRCIHQDPQSRGCDSIRFPPIHP